MAVKHKILVIFLDSLLLINDEPKPALVPRDRFITGIRNQV